MAVSPQDLLSALNFRYATKAFDSSRKISTEDWAALESSLALTPSSFGLQPWKFLVIDSTELREKLKAASWGQGQVTDASHLVVLTARTDLTQEHIDTWVARLSEVQGTPVENLAGLSGMISSFSSAMDTPTKQAWNTRQVYIALGQLMTSAAFMGIDTCPLEGISPADYDEILGLKDSGYATAVACALGYRSADDKYATAPKARFPEENVIAHI
ncbi:MAG: NAD(P)H-dependent oxidoreductase [Akkermansiaceae bacterium]|jgi:nitroreductase|nr:NAD(P)H-dependent oxidoreductase [Akkermansiaceae bacterium]MDP4646146.1 NAD(P)H-dependent oxidoreductase [Akkermansiaceae bacterium]MDP4720945.1 NAD(P)H-dependent oxidoreductase [Akkermansiaceae bacterium]MDP4780696.1 NAD(P)H-dependent oxidoreductase [Akkermansiaceae bacterium]MDP4845642.1 NAD(P)H-dependent oxidoreductase [Akkermansiaceae bacterium]